MKRSNLFRSSVVAAFMVTLITGGLVYSAYAGGQKDIVDTAIAAGSFKTLAAALTAADLVATLKGPAPLRFLPQLTRHLPNSRPAPLMIC